MDDGFSPVFIVLFAGIVLLEGTLYGFASAIQNVNEGRLADEAEEGSKKAARLLAIANRPGRLIHTIHFITDLMNIITGASIMFLFGREWISSLIAAVVLLLIYVSFGILVPKQLAKKSPEKWALGLLPAADVVLVLFWPAAQAVNLIAGLVLKLFGVDISDENDNVTEEDIMSMVNEGHEQGVLEADETEMITNIFELGDKDASDIMTHRTNMEVLDGSMTLKEAVDFILNEGINTRYPVYGEDIDDIIGILHLRDAVSCASGGEKNDWQIKDIPGLLREANFIPETRNIDTLFKEMQSKKIHMEIVVDEYGQTAGLLTMEDILEEIVGNIMDEYDEEEQFITPGADGTFIMSGLTPLDEVMDALDMEFDQEDRDAYDTLNGYLVSRLDRIPQEEEAPEVDCAGCRFRVLKAGNKMIESVLAWRLPEEKEEPEGTKELVEEKDDEAVKENRGNAQ